MATPYDQELFTLPLAAAAYRKRAADIYGRATEMDSAEPDVSQLEEYSRQRRLQGGDAMLNALAAQFAGEEFKPMQAQFLKQAAAAQDPMKLGSGIMTPEGKFISDPFASRERKINTLMNQAKAYEEMALTARTAQEKADAKKAQDAINTQLRLMGLNIQAALAQSKIDKSGDMPGTFTHAGFTPTGQSISSNSKTGLNYIVGVDQSGVPTYTPYTGAFTPKAAFEKNVSEVQKASASAKRADSLIKMVEENPNAFGLRAQAISSLPGFAQGRAGAVLLDQDTMAKRADILRQAAMEISDLYGAALSLGEQARANTFIPNKDDPPEAIIAKLKAARDWAKQTAGQYGRGVSGAAESRAGNVSSTDYGAPPPGSVRRKP